MDTHPPSCPLCKTPRPAALLTDKKTAARYFYCPVCDLRFLDPALRLTRAAEHERYLLHKNDVNAPDYQNFVWPLVEAIQSRFPRGARGLDFGCGPAPIMSHMLGLSGYAMTAYDPFFRDDASALAGRYDFVVASEVAEHFFNPLEELIRLRGLLNTNGAIGLMTALYRDSILFDRWYYRQDPTHVCFYSAQTFAWIKNRLNFSAMDVIGERTVVLRR